jgi:hypothetical protein
MCPPPQGDQALTSPADGSKPLFFGPRPSVMSIAAVPPPSSCTFGDLAALGTADGMPSVLLSPDTSFALALSAKAGISVGAVAGGPPLFAAAAVAGCLGPYRLVLRASGNLELRDKSNRTIWSSGSACRTSAAAPCYSYQVSNTGVLQVQDGVGSIVWASSVEGVAFGRQRRAQLVSESLPDLPCIWSGPAPLRSLLASPSGRYEAAVDESGGLKVSALVASG